MNKFLLACCALALPMMAAAQDMPLHEIIKAGETWAATDKKMPEVSQELFRVMPTEKAIRGPHFREDAKPATTLVPLARPSCLAVWHNGATLLVGDAGGKHVWAFRIEDGGNLSGGEKYCPLRLRPGETESEVSALCVDGSNRVYAAYKHGIMAFDPTGRPCGLIISPGGGPVTSLVFDGNNLYARVGEQVFVRKMLASGPAK